MLRMIIKAQTTKQVVLALHGKVVGPDVQLLAQEGDAYLQATPRLVLDLDAVSFIDQYGLALLKRWQDQGLALCGGSPFLQALLATHGLTVC